MRMRRAAYERDIFPVRKTGCPVISVGNITAGGTGKTPVVSHLLSWFSEKNIKSGVVSRGYRGHYSGVVSVEPNNPELFGDEATMLKRAHKSIPIYLGKRKNRRLQ